MVYATSSFLVTASMGVDIPELENKKLSKTARKIFGPVHWEEKCRWRNINWHFWEYRGMRARSWKSNTAKKVQTLKRVTKTKLKLFETSMSLHISKVWKTKYCMGSFEGKKIFLHYIKDSKICTRYGGLPKVEMTVTARMKKKVGCPNYWCSQTWDSMISQSEKGCRQMNTKFGLNTY